MVLDFLKTSNQEITNYSIFNVFPTVKLNEKSNKLQNSCLSVTCNLVNGQMIIFDFLTSKHIIEHTTVISAI